MSQLPEKMVLTAFAADALALSKDGSLSLQGEQMRILLEHLSSGGEWNLKNYHLDWQGEMKHYGGLTDTAVRTALAGAAEGKEAGASASLSMDIGPLARTAPLIWFFQEDEESMIHSIREYVSVTHRSPVILEAAQLFARTAFDILAGEELEPALSAVCEHMKGGPAAPLILQGMEVADLPPSEIPRMFGPAGTADQALPLLGYLLTRYSGNPVEGHRQNLMMGGDALLRAPVLGMLFGASLGLGSMEPPWLLGLKNRTSLQHLMGWEEDLEDLLRA